MSRPLSGVVRGFGLGLCTCGMSQIGPANGKLTASAPVTIVLHDPVYVGIGMCAQQADRLETAVFSNVKIERPAEK